MNKKVLRTLEYDKIIAKLTSLATCNTGMKYCQELVPITDIEELEHAQEETSCALSRILRFGSFNAQGVVDPKEYMSRLELGSSLNMTELLAVASLLETCRRAAGYEKEMKDEEDVLTHYFREIDPCSAVAREITRCIISEDTMADDASTNLSNLRRRAQITNDKIKSQLTQMLNNTTIRGYLQDGVITMRSGRYCLPVKAENKSFVPGMVHDQSATGSTFFIEPMSVVNLNNELREIALAEAEEIEKILAVLSNKVAEISDTILFDFDIIAKLDFIFAKAKLAELYNASRPVFNSDGIINIKGARHPLLDKDTVVPVDIKLGEEYNLLLVTGPNTGGKTVSLKTCGLFVLMAQSGLHIPAKDRSQVSIFEEVFADIGDEQSIEQSLSTFSSHMTNIVRILDRIDKISSKAGDKTPQFLCLFDELCAGTDPKEGAALAQAILHRLHTIDVRTMATTHYSELKMYALTEAGVENACCEFSLETLSPTYRLLIGIPGKSNAFAISKKLGLSDELISIAKTYISEDEKSFEDLVVELEHKRVEIEQDRLSIAEMKRITEQKLHDVENRQRKLIDSKDKILREANLEASQILSEAKEVADETIRDFNKYAKSGVSVAEMEKKRTAIGNKLNDSRSKAAIKQEPQVNNHVPKELHVGDRVKVLSMNLNGTVFSLPDKKGDLTVQMGIMKSTVNIKDLILIAEDNPYAPKKGQTKKTASYGGLNKAATISPEINLLGCTVDEGIAKLEKYLDDAYISHLSQVRVVHGKGTGALRAGVHQYLKRQSTVKSYHLAEFGEGDAGVTIVEFK